eukprot:COSAG05_NODE_5986_length_1045_cov_1.258985_1_plen_321_part_10
MMGGGDSAPDRRFTNPLARLSSSGSDDDETHTAAGTAGNTSSTANRKVARASTRSQEGSMRLSHASSSDWTLYDSDDDAASGGSGEVKIEAVITAFRRVTDLGVGGMGGVVAQPEHMKEVLNAVGWPSDDAVVQEVLQDIWEDGEKTGPIGEVSLQDFVTWWSSTGCHGYEAEPSCFTRVSGASAQILQQTQRTLGSEHLSKVSRRRGASSNVVGGAGVAPESIVLIDRGANDDNRETGETLRKIHTAFSKEFRFFEDVHLLREDDTHWQTLWEKAAAKRFAELSPELGLSEEAMEAAAHVIVDQFGMAPRLYRAFLRSKY